MVALLLSLQDNLDVLGLRQIHYSLLANNLESVLLHLPYYDPGNEKQVSGVIEFILGLKPSFVGFSLLYTEFQKSCDLTSRLRGAGLAAPIVWGGIQPTISPETCLEHADYVCVGEGEEVVVDIAEALSRGESLKGVRNLAYVENGRLVGNDIRPPVADLDALAHYDHVPKSSFIQERNGVISGLDEKAFRRNARYGGTVHDIMMTRGCPFSCTYCCNNFLSRLYPSGRLRRMSADKVMLELEKVVVENPYVEYVNFQDDCFLADSLDHLEDFCRKYRDRINRPFVIRSIPTYINEEKAALLRQAGLSWINVGLQSGSDRVLEGVYRRSSSREDFLKAAGIIHRLGIAAYYDVILDNPFEGDEDRLETARALMETPRPFYPQFYSLTLFPGTDLYERARVECPGLLEKSGEKDFMVCSKTPLNAVIRLCAFLPPGVCGLLIRGYAENPGGPGFKALLISARLATLLFFEPLMYLRVVLLSVDNSVPRLVRIAPSYFKDELWRYGKQFMGQ
jgi:anaerobic magnesium-protoporphyrin IX monomethyl ester cyclase